MLSSTGVVAFWHRMDGWGEIQSPDTPGGCFAHFSHVRTDTPDGYRELFPGTTVRFSFVQCEQDGYQFAATTIESTTRNLTD